MIRILLVDDHELMRGGLRSLVEQESDLTVVAEASSGLEVPRLVATHNPHLILMDVSMPDLNGIEATRLLRRDNSSLRILALSMHEDKRFVSEMLRAGANGYMLKDAAVAELVFAIRLVHSGKTYLAPDIAGDLVKEFIHLSPAQREQDAYVILSDRERQTLQQLAEGRSTHEIAENLSISAKTVETHRRNLKDKLGIESIANLTKYAINQGLTDL